MLKQRLFWLIPILALLLIISGIELTDSGSAFFPAMPRYNVYLPSVINPEPTPSETPTPVPPSLQLIQSRACTSSSYTYVYGEVRNNLHRPATFVKVNLTFYNPDNSIAGSDYTYTAISDLLDGQNSIFWTTSQPQPSFSRTTISLSDSNYSWYTVKNTPNLPISGVNSWKADYVFNVAGQVTNNTSQPINSVKIMAIFTDNAGQFVSTDYVYASPSTIAPGALASFQLSTYLSGCEASVTGYSSLYAIGQLP